MGCRVSLLLALIAFERCAVISFQRRYQALVVENDNALRRVIDYINLNPVRAGTVGRAAVARFRWGSLGRFVRGSRPTWLDTHVSLAGLDLEDTSGGWASYVEYLIALAGDPKRPEENRFDRMCRGWAIGTLGWRRTLAREYSALSLEAGLEREELREIKETGAAGGGHVMNRIGKGRSRLWHSFADPIEVSGERREMPRWVC